MKNIYDWIVTMFKPWTSFISEQTPNLQENAQRFAMEFTDTGYLLAIIIMITVSVVSAIVYYYIYSQYPGFRYRVSHWMSFLGINAMLVTVISLVAVILMVNSSGTASSMQYYIMLAIGNGLYSLGTYWIISLLIVKVVPIGTSGMNNLLFRRQ